MRYGRALVFGVAGVFLALGLILLVNLTSVNAWSGIMIRVGLLLVVIGIAWPQLQLLRSRASWLSLVVLFFMLLLIAARPRLFPVAAGLALGTLLLNGLLRRLSGRTPTRPK